MQLIAIKGANTKYNQAWECTLARQSVAFSSPISVHGKTEPKDANHAAYSQFHGLRHGAHPDQVGAS